VDLRIFTEPQEGATYDQLLAVAQLAEAEGFDAFFRSDHYQAISSSEPGPGSTDAWITLAGLARETSRIRLGTLVTPVTFRLPGPLAISVAQVDAMSGGRVELGLGTAWYDTEHASYGIPFYDTAARFAMLEEQLEILTGLWATPAGETYSFAGTHHVLEDSPALPKPVQQPHPPIIVGGHGPKRTPRLVARYADEYNLPFGSLEVFGEQKRRVTEACEAVDRDPATVTFSSALTVCCAEDEAGLERRAAAIGQPLEQLRLSGLAGTPAELVETLGRWADAGSTRTYLQVLDVTDLDHVRLIASSVLPEVADL
jgi:F420-dependent oxidoreductase-like protein